jgi:S-adenosylmethionine synthetase
VFVAIEAQQSPDIELAQQSVDAVKVEEDIGAGDQYIMFGYRTPLMRRNSTCL